MTVKFGKLIIMSYICVMKLTKKLKDRIESWFNSKTPEQVIEIGKKYGIGDEDKCICELQDGKRIITGHCHKHHTSWI